MLKMNKALDVIVLLAAMGFLFVSNSQLVIAQAHVFPVTVTSSFVLDQDSMWRAHTNVTVTNDYQGNITIDWIQITLINVTYVDGTSENNLSISGNITVGQLFNYGQNCTVTSNLTAAGFSKEPKNMGLTVELSVQGFENQVTSVLIVPEYSSFLASLLVMLSVTVMIVLGRKKIRNLARAQKLKDLKT
jgi:hypothetical protein